MLKNYLLVSILWSMHLITNAQKKLFATKQEAENFMVETIKKTLAPPYIFSDYKDGELLLKNTTIEKVDDDDKLDANELKSNAYRRINFNNIIDIKCEEKNCEDRKFNIVTLSGFLILERGYIVIQNKHWINREMGDEITLLDETERIDKRKTLVFGSDTLLRNDFLEACKTFSRITNEKHAILKTIYDNSKPPKNLLELVTLFEENINKTDAELSENIGKKYLNNTKFFFKKFEFKYVTEDYKNPVGFVYKNKNGSMVACRFGYTKKNPRIYIRSLDKAYLEELSNEKNSVLNNYEYGETGDEKYWNFIAIKKD